MEEPFDIWNSVYWQGVLNDVRNGTCELANWHWEYGRGGNNFWIETWFLNGNAIYREGYSDEYGHYSEDFTVGSRRSTKANVPDSILVKNPYLLNRI